MTSNGIRFSRIENRKGIFTILISLFTIHGN